LKIGNCVSVCDGISCGQIALERAGIEVENYYASEIKENAIKVTQHNYPKTIQLGDLREVDPKKLPKIELLIGGTPCQDLSRASSIRSGLKGKKSSLFWEYVRLLEELKPKYFLFENVGMEPRQEAIITKALGTYPVKINSGLVSGQSRDRLYWTNIGQHYHSLFSDRICAIPQPKDKKIKLQDVLEKGWTNREKSQALLTSEGRPYTNMRLLFRRYYEINFTTLVFKSKEIYEECCKQYQDPNSKIFTKENVRYLTSVEMERLQTIPEGYTSVVSRDHAGWLIADGWTVDVIAHILSYLKI